MEIPGFSSWFDKLLPVLTFFVGLFADWFKQQLGHRREEKKHIAKAIADLLDLRYRLLWIREAPKMMQQVLPKVIFDQVPIEALQAIDFSLIIPLDERATERYQKAVDEISAFRPLLAYHLRGKEKYMDYRKGVIQHFQKTPGPPQIAVQITEILDNEYLPAIEEMLVLLGKCHGFQTRIAIWWKLRQRNFEGNALPPGITKVIENHFELFIAAEKLKADNVQKATDQKVMQQAEPIKS